MVAKMVPKNYKASNLASKVARFRSVNIQKETYRHHNFLVIYPHLIKFGVE